MIKCDFMCMPFVICMGGGGGGGVKYNCVILKGRPTTF